MKISMTVIICLFVSSVAFGQIPEYDESYVYCATDEVVGVFCPWDGGLSSSANLSQAYDQNHQLTDATITLVVQDSFGQLIENFPAEDMWLVSNLGDMVPCSGLGLFADSDTDANGSTTFTGPYNFGGNCETVVVFLNGLSLNGSPFTNIKFISPDMNADGVVNLVDYGLFASFYNGTYDYSADFYFDGVINLVDLGRMTAAIGNSCN